MNHSPELGNPEHRLATLLAGEPLSGWRGRLLHMGEVRGVVLITAVSLLASLAVTAGIGLLVGSSENMTADLSVAAIVPLIMALVLVDIDNCKRITDTRGHVTGDQVLQNVAEVLHAQVRPYELAARFGGEEFVLLLPDSTKAEGAQVAERESLGIAALDAAPDGADALPRRADAALHEAKTGGRNRSIVANAPAAAGSN